MPPQPQDQRTQVIKIEVSVDAIRQGGHIDANRSEVSGLRVVAWRPSWIERSASSRLPELFDKGVRPTEAT